MRDQPSGFPDPCIIRRFYLEFDDTTNPHCRFCALPPFIFRLEAVTEYNLKAYSESVGFSWYDVKRIEISFQSINSSDYPIRIFRSPYSDEIEFN